ncbi:hypothetical protein ACFLWX_03940 [Chloroflexota bacterium]
MLEGFISRFNTCFGVPSAQESSAYRSLKVEYDIGRVLCVKTWQRVARGNTMQYQGRVLQLYLGLERPSYADTSIQG